MHLARPGFDPRSRNLKKIYTGIGSRETPARECELITEFARLMCARGWTMRTGGARGADTAFLSGVLLFEPRYELYLPWRHFSTQAPATLEAPTERALGIAARYHPAWSRLTQSERNLHGRNVHQVLGYDCETPTRMIVCWTPVPSLTGHETGTGGTGMALRIAAVEAPEAEVINLVIPEHWNRIVTWVDPAGERFQLREIYQQDRLL